MKALLINPHKLIPASLSVTQSPSPPLGLAYIAAVLEKNGFDVSIFDCIAEAPNVYFPFDSKQDIYVYGIEFEKMFKLLDTHYDIIGIGLMFSNNWLINRHLINLLKKKYTNTLIIAGGEHASAIPEFCLLDCIGLDVIVVGEGEETISTMASLINDGKDWQETDGIVYKSKESDSEIVINPKQKRIRTIEGIPFPAWHLFPIDKYFENNISYGVGYGRSLPINATRGCPYECTFCSSPQMWTTKYTMRGVDDVLSEIIYLHDSFGVSNFDFFDLTAIINKRWILEFCQKIVKQGLLVTLQFPSGTRTEAITQEVALALKSAGCKNITYAPESGSKKVLFDIKKKVDLSNMLDSIKSSHKVGLNVKLNIIIGFPEETILEIFETFWFLVKAAFYGASDASPTIFSLYPGSALFNKIMKKGEIKLNDSYFRKIVFSESFNNFTTYNKNMSKGTLVFLQYLGYLIFYFANYFFRPLRFARTIRNILTEKYETRGEMVLVNVLKRNKLMRNQKFKTSTIVPQ